MRVYVAAPYGAREQARTWCDWLLADGHKITSQWVYGTREITAATVHTAPGLPTDEVDVYARGDLDDVGSADVLVLMTESVAEIAAGGAGSDRREEAAGGREGGGIGDDGAGGAGNEAN